MQFSGAEIIIKMLEKEGITVVSGIPGGANLPLYHALAKSSIRHVLTRHEQGAGFIAQGMARSTGKPAVCFATSGPGATNLVTAIADAKADSVPIIAITGQVPTTMLGTDAFQEVDMFGITLPITKHNYLVRSAGELPRIMSEAFRIALSGRPGPVVIDVPKDVQLEQVEIQDWPAATTQEHPDIDEAALQRIAALVNASQRPVLYIGGGIVHAHAFEELRAFARRSSIPVASTLLGLGCFPASDPLNLGMLGMHGAAATNFILQEADLLLACGVRFDDRATGNIAHFCPQAKIVHIDIDPAEIGKNRRVDEGLAADIRIALAELLPRILPDQRLAWGAFQQEMRSRHQQAEPRDADMQHPRNIIRAVAEIVGPETIITTDVGQHQMWVAQTYPFNVPRTLLTSGGLGTMGFGLPAGIGAALANPGRRVVCFSGDGSILMNIQELATLAELGLDVTVIIMNNGHLGMVRQQQELFYQATYIASRFESRPDFAAIARGFGLRGYDLGNTPQPRQLLATALRGSRPCVVNAPVRGEENVFPMVPPGAGNTRMIGFAPAAA